MRFPNGIRFLKVPNVLQDKWLFFLLIFVSHDVPRVCRRDAQEFVFYIGDEFASVYFRQRNFHRLFIFHFVVFALRGDAPAAHAGDLRMGVVGDRQRAKLAAAGPQNLVGFANCYFDFVRGLYRYDSLGVKQHHVRLLIVRRQRHIYQRVHPAGRVSSRGPGHSGKTAHRTECEINQNSPHFNYPPRLRRAATRSAVHLPSSLPERNSGASDRASLQPLTDPYSVAV